MPGSGPAIIVRTEPSKPRRGGSEVRVHPALHSPPTPTLSICLLLSNTPPPPPPPPISFGQRNV